MQSKKVRLNALQKKMAAADLLLKKTATNLVFGAVNPEAKIVFVGEAPGKNEDLKGLPFIGSAGKILDQLLQSIQINRQDIYITSILKYRPPNNRNPSLAEIKDHSPFLTDQIRIIAPKVIVPLGNFATRFILGGFNVDAMNHVSGISNLHGKTHTICFEGQNFVVIPVYHPAAVLYNPPLRKTLDQDFKKIARALN